MLKTRCKKFDEETLEIVMASLQRQGKAVLFITPEGEKVWAHCITCVCWSSVCLIPSLATTCTCPHARQKHVLPANQNSTFWRSNFIVYLPTLEHFSATPQTFEGKQSWSATCSGILCLEFWKSEWMTLQFLIWMPTQKNTDSHFAIRQVQTLICDFFHDIF